MAEMTQIRCTGQVYSPLSSGSGCAVAVRPSSFLRTNVSIDQASPHRETAITRKAQMRSWSRWCVLLKLFGNPIR